MIRLTRAQVREVDRRAIEEYHIPGIVLMENAARAVVDVACQKAATAREDGAFIVCGGGNNGGDGLAVARHLHNRGWKVTVAIYGDASKYAGDAKVNFEIVSAMGLPMMSANYDTITRSGAGLVIDAVFGTGLREAPRDPFGSDVAFAAFVLAAPVLSIDIPSGLDCDSGLALGNAVIADWTVTFVAEKAGFANPESKQYTGEVIVGDIGCPRELIEEVARVG
jgi:NAD(P)H-hydrate epimerase